MSHESNMQLMQALTDTRAILGKLRFESVWNDYAWNKLNNIQSYLAREQETLGRAMFDAPEPIPDVSAREMAS